MLKVDGINTIIKYTGEDSIKADISILIEHLAESMERNGWDSSELEKTVRDSIAEAKRSVWY